MAFIKLDLGVLVSSVCPQGFFFGAVIEFFDLNDYRVIELVLLYRRGRAAILVT